MAETFLLLIGFLTTLGLLWWGLDRLEQRDSRHRWDDQ